MYTFWCVVNIALLTSRKITPHQKSYIYFHIQPITFLLHTSQKALWHLLFNFHQQNPKNNICIKQTKIDIQNESKTIVATSVSKTVT